MPGVPGRETALLDSPGVVTISFLQSFSVFASAVRPTGGNLMKLKSILAVGAVLLLAGSVAFATKAQPVETTREPGQIVFVCRNGVSMSVWSAAYFNRLASARGLRQRAIARAAIPSYTTVPLRMMFALAVDGFRLGGYRPHVVSPHDVENAERVVVVQSTDDTMLPPEVQAAVHESEVWQGFPPMRDHYFPSRSALRGKIEDLVERIAATSR